jgi:hypothetical protein
VPLEVVLAPSIITALRAAAEAYRALLVAVVVEPLHRQTTAVPAELVAAMVHLARAEAPQSQALRRLVRLVLLLRRLEAADLVPAHLATETSLGWQRALVTAL